MYTYISRGCTCSRHDENIGVSVEPEEGECNEMEALGEQVSVSDRISTGGGCCDCCVCENKIDVD